VHHSDRGCKEHAVSLAPPSVPDFRMGTEGNKDVVRRMVEECINGYRPELLDAVVSADVRVHPGTPGTAPDTEGIEELRGAVHGFRSTFPDLHIALDQLVAEDDLVTARWTATGTHTGELAGIAPTNRAVRWGGMDVYRLADGRIVEWWRNDDFVWLLSQLGRDVLAD
jgi:predicted ester cyclase